MARGYLKRDELTEERFVRFRPDGNAEVRVYRTGDICRYLPDGSIEYRGRVDDQVKIRGFRIELGEVEAALAEYPNVTQCAVLVKEPTAGNKQLVAFVAGPPEGAATEDIKSFLRDRLPGYMVPAVCVCLPELPLSGAGKINRQALHKLDVAHEASARFVAPRHEQDERMAKIWQDVLGLDRIGIHDNFFDLGGHSLIATQLVSRILHEFGVRMPLLQLFQGPTIAAMSDYVAQQPQQASTIGTAAITPQERPSRIPVTLGQARLWRIDQINPGLPTYNMPAAFHVKGPFDVDILRRVVAEMVRRHEILRTTFKEADGKVIQVIHDDIDGIVDVVDVTSIPEKDRPGEIRRLAEEELMRPFDLTAGPLLRVRVFPANEQEFLLTLVMNHGISDGWSVDIISRELALLYECFAHGRPSVLPELPIQFADFAIWHENFRRTEEYQKQVDFWKQHLHNAPDLLQLRTDMPRPAVKTFQGDSIEVLFEEEFVTQLHRLCREEGVTLNTLLYAALSVVMRHNSGQDDMVIGTSIATRNRREVEDLIGLFTNNMALRIDLTGEPRFSEVLQRAHQICLNAFAHQDVPISQVIDVSGKEVRRDYHPLFQVTMVLQNNSANTGWTLPEQSLEISSLPNSHKESEV